MAASGADRLTRHLVVAFGREWAPMPEITRRRLLATAGTAAAAAFVVILMQENRSFDHYFGTLPGVRGFADPAALTLSTGKSVFYQPDPDNPDGYLLPFHLNTQTTSAQAIPSTRHAWTVQHSAWDSGKMDNWLPAHLAADGKNGSVLATASLHTVATVPVGRLPGSVAVTPDGSQVWVGNNLTGNISVINPASDTVSATISGGSGTATLLAAPLGIAFTKAG